ncbi:MAG: hypothetical protein ACYCX2_02345 [Christensenellales bacterium]
MMTTWVLASFLLLSAVDIYLIFRFLRERKPLFFKSVLTTYLFLCIYLLSMFLFRWQIPEAVLLFVIAAKFIHTFFGYSLNLYERTKAFDHITHAIGCFAYSLLAYCTLASILGSIENRGLSAIFVFAIGMSLGVFIEIAEYLYDTKRRSFIMMQKGLKDTDVDLMFDTLGSALAGVYVYFYLF